VRHAPPPAGGDLVARADDVPAGSISICCGQRAPGSSAPRSIAVVPKPGRAIVERDLLRPPHQAEPD
jgi:hypothetical protein